MTVNAWPNIELFNVSSMIFDDLLASEDPNLDRCILRLVTSLDDPDGIISAFQSFASDS